MHADIAIDGRSANNYTYSARARSVQRTPRQTIMTCFSCCWQLCCFLASAATLSRKSDCELLGRFSTFVSDWAIR